MYFFYLRIYDRPTDRPFDGHTCCIIMYNKVYRTNLDVYMVDVFRHGVDRRLPAGRGRRNRLVRSHSLAGMKYKALIKYCVIFSKIGKDSKPIGSV